MPPMAVPADAAQKWWWDSQRGLAGWWAQTLVRFSLEAKRP